MLDIGFSELLLLGAVALIVLGPEKLPHAARMAGAWYGRIRRTLANVQAEIANEVHLAEMRKKMDDELAAIREAKDDFTSDLKEIENSIYPIQSDANPSQNFENTDWTQGIEAPMKSATHRFYFFFVPQSMYRSLIPATPYLPKLKQTKTVAKLTHTEHFTDAASL